MMPRIATGLACILAAAGLGPATVISAPVIPAPVVHAPADHGVAVAVDDLAMGDDSLAIAEAVAEAKWKRAGRLVFATQIYRIANPKAAEGAGQVVLDGLPAATQFEKGLSLLPNTYLAAGTRVAVRHSIYDAYGCFVTEDSNDVAFENVEVRQTPGMGFMAAIAGRGFQFSNIRGEHLNRQERRPRADVVRKEMKSMVLSVVPGGEGS